MFLKCASLLHYESVIGICFGGLMIDESSKIKKFEEVLLRDVMGVRIQKSMVSVLCMFRARVWFLHIISFIDMYRILYKY